MKKVLFVLVFVAAYGVSMAMSGSNVVTVVGDTQVTFVASLDNDNIVAPEGGDEKDKKEGKKGKSKAKAESCDHSKAKSCSDSKAKECSEKEKAGNSSCCEEKK